MWINCVTYTLVLIQMTIVGMADHLYDGAYVIKQGVTVSLHFYYSMGVGKKRQRGKTKKKKNT